MAQYDAGSQNNITRNVRQYTDLDLFFGKKSSNSDVQEITDVKAVKRSIRNLVLLNHYEKPFHPEIASGVRDMLFELITPITATILARKIEDVIQNFEPRARLVSVTALPNLDRNEYEVSIEFINSMNLNDTDFYTRKNDRYFFDLPKLAKVKLNSLGVFKIVDSKIDTYKNKNYFSYRRSIHQRLKDYGRNISLVSIN